MDWLTILTLVAGLGVLTLGAEFLVRGSARLAALFGISPLVVGLTVVAIGTSTPELAVNVQSAYSGQADLALGNVVGSNIFNVLFILGICAVVLPLRVAQQLLWLDVPLMIGASIMFLVLALDGIISRFDGIFLLVGAGLYMIVAVKLGRNESPVVEKEYAEEYGQRSAGYGWPLQVFLIAVGLAMLVVGARWLVSAAVEIAQLLGISELIIGLTIIAAGTSLPEVATSIIASIRGERDIAVGNVVGSNLFNILLVLGLTSVVAPSGISVQPAILTFDIPVLIAVAVACAPIFLTGHIIERWEGCVFVLYYAAYTAYLILDAKGHDSLPAFSTVMLEFVLPITLLTLVIAYVRHNASNQLDGKNK